MSGVTHQEAKPAPKWVPRVVIGAILLLVLLVAGFMVVRVVLTLS
jgi:hypothetical protein